VSGVPRILLVTWTPPGCRNVGEIILRDLCSFLPPASLRICEVSNFPDAGSDYEGIRLAAPDEQAWYPLPGRVGGFFNHLRVRFAFRRQADRLVQAIADYALAQGVEKIWLTLSSQALIRVGAQLAEKTQLPILSLVWDPADFLASHQGWDSHSVRWTMRNFHRTMARSSRAMVVSEPMVQRYSSDYGIPCTVVRHAFEESPVELNEAVDDQQPIRIGFAGTLYDQSQLNCLLEALNQLEWALGGRPIILRMIGNFYRFTKLQVPAQVELLGWRGTEATRQLLTQCTFAYLPVSFQSSYAEFARLAFPTKLSTYLAAGRPVLVHAPDYAAPVPFCQELGFGAVCTSMSVDALKSTILALCTPGVQLSMMKNVRRTHLEHFSRKVMRRQFAKFLDVEEEGLSA